MLANEVCLITIFKDEINGDIFEGNTVIIVMLPSIRRPIVNTSGWHDFRLMIRKDAHFLSTRNRNASTPRSVQENHTG